MNDVLGLFIALFLPALLGYSWLNMLWQDSHPAARIGYGYFLGISLTAFLLYVWGNFALLLQFNPLAIVLIIFTLLPVFLRRSISQQPDSTIFNTFNASWQKIVWSFLIALLIVRFCGLLLEEIWRPLYPWDAWMNWAPKAKVWFELRELVPFVHYFDWGEKSLEMGAYALGNPEASTYPPLVPLIQTWTALAIGGWRDNWVNLPWAVAVIAFFLAFYGQLRMLRFPPLRSMIITTMLFSMPYLNTHVALAGYAEIWVTAFYCMAVMALINWSLTNSRMQMLLMILMGIACTQAKIPGLVWAATLLPGILLVMITPKSRYVLLVAIVMGTALILINGGINPRSLDNQSLILTSNLLQVPGLGRFSLAYHPVSEFFVKNDLVRSNWHLLGWLLLILTPLAMIRTIFYPRLLPGMVTLLAGITFVLIVFFFTDHYKNAIDSTTLNRATLHLLPALFYFVMVIIVHDRRIASNG